LEGKKGVIKRVEGRWRVEEWRWQRRAIAQWKCDCESADFD